MKKAIKLMGLLGFVIMYLGAGAQIKVYSGGNVCVGSTSIVPNKPLVVSKSGGIRILQAANADSTNEVVFGDNGQIRSKDNNHRIIFDRANNIIELREYGDLYFSPGATTGARTQKITFTAAGDLNINGGANSLQINSIKMLWNNNNVFDLFVGDSAGNASMSGHFNTFMGTATGFANTSGTLNSFVGYRAGKATTTGVGNTALGGRALLTNTTGQGNTAIGAATLAVSTGDYNTAIGNAAGVGITGTNNTIVGAAAGIHSNTGSNNTFVGGNADANANVSNAAAFGYNTVVTASNKIFIGNSSITNIQGQVGFTTYSDGRFKTNVTENVKGLEFINKLRPVTYKMDTKALDDFIIQNMTSEEKERHRKGMDFTASKAIVHSGFIAQEVEQAAKQVGFVSSIVSAPSNSNDPYALSYAEIVVPLVKAVQELSHHLDSLQTTDKAKDEQLQVLQDRVNQLENASGTASANSNSAAINTKNNVVLYQNKPNPFNNQTTIEYYIPTTCDKASILIFDMQGKLMKTIVLEQKENGSIKIDAGSLYPGMYMYSLVVDGKEMDTKRMILTK